MVLRGRERRQATSRQGGDGNTFQEMHSRLIVREKVQNPENGLTGFFKGLRNKGTGCALNEDWVIPYWYWCGGPLRSGYVEKCSVKMMPRFP